MTQPKRQQCPQDIEARHEREEAELLERYSMTEEDIALWVPALNNHVRGVTEEEQILVRGLKASLARERELAQRVENFERYIEREIEPKLLQRAEQAEAHLAQREARVEELAEAHMLHVRERGHLAWCPVCFPQSTLQDSGR